MANLKMVSVLTLAVLAGACSSHNTMVTNHADGFRAPAQASALMKTVFGSIEREGGPQLARSVEQKVLAKISSAPGYYGVTGAIRTADDLAGLPVAAQERILVEMMQSSVTFGLNATVRNKVFASIKSELTAYSHTQIDAVVNPSTVTLSNNNLGLGMGTQRIVNEANALNAEVMPNSQAWLAMVKGSSDINVKKAVAEAIGLNASIAKQTGGLQALGKGCQKLMPLDAATAFNIRELLADVNSSLRNGRALTKAEFAELFDASQRRVMNVNDAQALQRRKATACSTGDCGDILNRVLCPL